MNSRVIRFGVFAPPIEQQVPELSEQDAKRINALCKATSLLGIHDIATTVERRKMERRIVKLIYRILSEQQK